MKKMRKKMRHEEQPISLCDINKKIQPTFSPSPSFLAQLHFKILCIENTGKQIMELSSGGKTERTHTDRKICDKM
jgi:hypothetical protein